MFRKTPVKRRKKIAPSKDGNNPPANKVYVMKIISNQENGIQIQLEPDKSTLSTSDHVMDLCTIPSEDCQSEENLVADEILQSVRVVDLQSSGDDSMQSPELVLDGNAQNDNNEIMSHDNNQQSSVQDSALSVLGGTSGDAGNMQRESKPIKKQAFSGWIANRHKLRFQEKWFEQFPFIEYDEKNNLMFCKACRKYVIDYRKTSTFVVGTDHFRESVIKCHERSSMHAECQELADAISSQDNEADDKDLYREQLAHVFKSVYFIFKNKLPYTHYPQLCESQKREGTDFTVYTTQFKIAPLFGKFISMAFEKQLAQTIANIPEFALVIDASFQRNIERHELVYLKYVDNFIIQTVFLGVIDSTTKLHESMYIILTGLFKRYNIDNWADKIVYIMTDKSDFHIWLEGLVNLIKGMSPRNFLTEMNYPSHKVKFCSSIVQNHKVSSTFDALLFSIYCYYEKVHKVRKNLVHMNKELDDITERYGALPKNSYSTLYFESLKAIENDYAPLVQLLEAEHLLLPIESKLRKSGARILAVITHGSFICKLALFIDIFSCLNDFATRLSSEYLLPYDVHMVIDEVCAGIEKAADGEGPAAIEIAQELSATPSLFRGIEIIEDINVYQVLSEVKNFSCEIISHLRSLVDESLFEKSYIFNVCLWPEDEELSQFGNSEFKDIFFKFNGKKEELDLALAEWILFKRKVVTLFPFEVRQNSKSVVMKMVTDYTNDFPFVTAVLRKILLLNFECSEIKRGYYEMCLSKSASRSVLSLQSLQTSMMISMHGPSLGEFDYSLALEMFLNSKHRKFRKKIIDKKLTLSYPSDQDESNSVE